MTEGSRVHVALAQSQAYGFLGPGPLETPLRHANAFIDVVCREVERLDGDASTSTWLDLGSGGGLPGLVGIDRLPESSWVLLDAQGKRIRFLESVLDDWQVTQRVRCALGRAEEIYRAGEYSEVDIVVARGFGQPAITAECATGFLPVGGMLVVSEPPHSDGSRWLGIDGAPMGFSFSGIRRSGGFGFAVLRKIRHHAALVPRSGALLAKQPLF